MIININKHFIYLAIVLVIFIGRTNIVYKYYEDKVLQHHPLRMYQAFPPPPSIQYKSSHSPSKTNWRKLNKLERKEFDNFNYNKCVTEKIPKVTGQLETAQYLRYTNSSLVRFGDGEMRLIMGKDIHNKEKPNRELSRRLLEIFKDYDERIAVGIPNVFTFYPYYRKRSYHSWYIRFDYIIEWMLKNVNYSRQYFDNYITSPYITTQKTSCELVDKVYENLRAIWENKDIVWLRGNNGEVYEYDVFDNVKSKTVHYGLANYSWSKYSEYKELLFKEDPNKLFIITLGHLSRLLAYDLAKAGRRALDLGHLPKDYNVYRKGISDPNFYFV